MKAIVAFLFVVVVLAIAFHMAPTATTATVAQQSGTYVQMAREDAQQAGIDPNVFIRQIRQESGFDPNAMGPSGEVGIAQFMPATARGLGIDPHDPVQALKGAAQLMGRYVHKYHSEALALAAYNAGSGTVSRCLRTRSWYRCLPGITQRYIAIILQWKG